MGLWRAAARAVRFARRERYLRTEADAWRVLARIERGSARASVFVDRARKADARDASQTKPDHPLARQWRHRAVPLDETFGCYAARWEFEEYEEDSW